MKLRIPKPPNYIIIDNGIFGQRQDGFKENEKIDLGEFTEDQLDELIKTVEASYRVHWNKRKSILNKVQ